MSSDPSSPTFNNNDIIALFFGLFTALTSFISLVLTYLQLVQIKRYHAAERIEYARRRSVNLPRRS